MKILRTLLSAGFLVQIYNDIRLRDHCHISKKYRGGANRDCNIKVKLNYKIPIIFENLNNFDAYPIMQELVNFVFKINAIPNGLEKI